MSKNFKSIGNSQNNNSNNNIIDKNNTEKNIEEKNKGNKNNNSNKLEISSMNNININPPLKKNFITLKNYFNNNESKYKRTYRIKSNSFDMSLNTDSKIISNFETSFCKKLSFNSPKKANVKKINIKCCINEPQKVSFRMIVGKKVEIILLKKIICEQLSKKNKAYKDLKINGFCLMKNYSFVHEYGNVGDSILSDGDDVYIILIESMDKCQEDTKSKNKKK